MSRLQTPMLCGASNTVGAKAGVAPGINETETRALLRDCHGKALQLAVGGTIKAVKLIRSTLDATFDLNKLIKYSPKREGALNRLREGTVPRNSVYRILCPTRWSVGGASLQSILDNWAVF